MTRNQDEPGLFDRAGPQSAHTNGWAALERGNEEDVDHEELLDDERDSDWEEDENEGGEEEDHDDVVYSLISDLAPSAALDVAVNWRPRDQLSGYGVDARERLAAARQLLWQDPPTGVDALLAQVADVNIEDGDRLAVIRLAVAVGPSVKLAAAWLLARIAYAHLEGRARTQAVEIANLTHPGAEWWPDAFALIARNSHLDLDDRAEAAATLVGTTPGRAAYLVLPNWFSIEDLPGALHEATQRGSEWAYNLLRLLATDSSLAAEIRVDAAEWLTSDPDETEPIGEEVLLSTVEDALAEPLVRARALFWLEGNEDTWGAVDGLLRMPARAKRWPVELHSDDPVADYLALYHVALAGAVDAYTHTRAERIDRPLRR